MPCCRQVPALAYCPAAWCGHRTAGVLIRDCVQGLQQWAQGPGQGLTVQEDGGSLSLYLDPFQVLAHSECLLLAGCLPSFMASPKFGLSTPHLG